MRIRHSVFPLLLALLLPQFVLAQNQQANRGWPVSTPQSVGLDAKTLAAFDADIASGKYGYVDSMLIVRNGKVVYDRSYEHDYDRIYGVQAKKSGPSVIGDPTGPYNYFNPCM